MHFSNFQITYGAVLALGIAWLWVFGARFFWRTRHTAVNRLTWRPRNRWYQRQAEREQAKLAQTTTRR